MRDRWYGDNRDLVKWATLIHLARANRVGTILQVALYRQDEASQLLKDDNPIAFPPAVRRHFPRNLDDISRLAREARVMIEVFKEPFARPSTAYFESLAKRVDTLHPRRLIVFLDPDTGMAPTTSDCRHVRKTELATVFSRLRPQDWLVLYQHRQLFRKNWVEENSKKFLSWLPEGRSEVNMFSSPIAKDVIFFAVQKTGSRTR